jgi:uncharacterized membrane protein YqjE
MNTQAGEVHERGILPLLMSMISTRVELAAIDTEAHVKATLSAILTALVAVLLALMAFAFIGVAVIVVFWETHRIAAASGVLAAYASMAVAGALLARSAWKSRPPAFAATLHELELDRSTFRSRP